MKYLYSILLVFLMTFNLNAQYDPGAINYGITANKDFQSLETAGLGLRVEYAYNCYTTYTFEYNRNFSFADNSDNYGEFAAGVNLILFNFHPTTITAGMGYIVNSDSNFEEEEDDATLFFQSGNLNHGVQIKLRALHQISSHIHLFTEVNLKSLGNKYHNLTFGFNYEFNPRR